MWLMACDTYVLFLTYVRLSSELTHCMSLNILLWIHCAFDVQIALVISSMWYADGRYSTYITDGSFE